MTLNNPPVTIHLCQPGVEEFMTSSWNTAIPRGLWRDGKSAKTPLPYYLPLWFLNLTGGVSWRNRALLIGSQTGGLTGVHTDVKAMADRLAHWGFATKLCIGGEATRQGILAQYKALIDQTSAGDPVVVYYSGHGGGWPTRITSP